MVFNETFNNIYSNTTGAFYVQITLNVKCSRWSRDNRGLIYSYTNSFVTIYVYLNTACTILLVLDHHIDLRYMLYIFYTNKININNTTGAFYVQWYVGCFEALQYFTLEEAT
jgi:hypothetical protein